MLLINVSGTLGFLPAFRVRISPELADLKADKEVHNLRPTVEAKQFHRTSSNEWNLYGHASVFGCDMHICSSIVTQDLRMRRGRQSQETCKVCQALCRHWPSARLLIMPASHDMAAHLEAVTNQAAL